MKKLLAPMACKFLVNVWLIASTTVSVPTKDKIPMAIMKMVIKDLSLYDLTAEKACLRYS